MFQSLKCSKPPLGTISILAAFLFVSGCGGTPQQRAKNYYEQGVKLLEQKDYVKASIEFKNAIQLNSSLTDAWRGLAQVEEHNKNLRDLSAIWRKIIELDPKDIEGRLKLAAYMLMGNNSEEALKLANAALTLNDHSAEGLMLKAAALLRMNDAGGAITEAQKALEIEPDNAGALMVLAAEKATRGDNQGALEVLDRATSAQENFGIQFFKIQMFEKMGDFKQVESLLKKTCRSKSERARLPPATAQTLYQSETDGRG